MTEQTTYPITLGSVKRELPLFEVAPGVRIAVLNILGDTELVEAAANALAERLVPIDYAVLVSAEAKSIPLLHALSRASGKPYVVLRKSYKTYMGDALVAETRSITTGEPQTLYLDAKDRAKIAGARVALIDDVVSSGSTLTGMRRIMGEAGATVAAEAAMLTEGDWDGSANVIALGHVPVFTDGGIGD